MVTISPSGERRRLVRQEIVLARPVLECCREKSMRPALRPRGLRQTLPEMFLEVSALPEAMTGTGNRARNRAAVSGQSNPERVPSLSIDVIRISPAPQSTPWRAQATASIPVGTLPPRTKASQRSPTRLASTSPGVANTACDPNSAASSVSRAGLRIAAVFYSRAPRQRLRAGCARPWSTCCDTAASGQRNRQFDGDSADCFQKCGAVIARCGNVQDHEFIRALDVRNEPLSAAGSPATSRRLTKFTPLTTRSPSVSRHGMMRCARLMACRSREAQNWKEFLRRPGRTFQDETAAGENIFIPKQSGHE